MQYEIKNYKNYRYIVYKFEKDIDSTILDEVKEKAGEDAKRNEVKEIENRN